MKKVSQLFELFILCILSACGIQTTQGGDGGATETINALVIISDSTAAVTVKSDTEVLADVMIFDENYDPVNKTGFHDSATGVTPGSGTVFSKLNGVYNIIIYDRLSQSSLALNGITIGTFTSDTISDTLSAPGSIEGTVSFNKPSGTETPTIMVYLKGTSFHTEADSGGAFQMQSIPRGNYFMKAAMFYTKSSSGKSVGKEIEIKSSMKIDSLTLFFSE